MEELILLGMKSVVQQGPLVVLCLAALYFTRMDLKEQKADNKELLTKVLTMHEATLTVIRENTSANVKLAEAINDLEAG